VVLRVSSWPDLFCGAASGRAGESGVKGVRRFYVQPAGGGIELTYGRITGGGVVNPAPRQEKL